MAVTQLVDKVKAWPFLPLDFTAIIYKLLQVEKLNCAFVRNNSHAMNNIILISLILSLSINEVWYYHLIYPKVTFNNSVFFSSTFTPPPKSEEQTGTCVCLLIQGNIKFKKK